MFPTPESPFRPLGWTGASLAAAAAAVVGAAGLLQAFNKDLSGVPLLIILGVVGLASGSLVYWRLG